MQIPPFPALLPMYGLAVAALPGLMLQKKLISVGILNSC